MKLLLILNIILIADLAGSVHAGLTGDTSEELVIDEPENQADAERNHKRLRKTDENLDNLEPKEIEEITPNKEIEDIEFQARESQAKLEEFTYGNKYPYLKLNSKGQINHESMLSIYESYVNEGKCTKDIMEEISQVRLGSSSNYTRELYRDIDKKVHNFKHKMLEICRGQIQQVLDDFYSIQKIVDNISRKKALEWGNAMHRYALDYISSSRRLGNLSEASSTLLVSHELIFRIQNIDDELLRTFWRDEFSDAEKGGYLYGESGPCNYLNSSELLNVYELVSILFEKYSRDLPPSQFSNRNKITMTPIKFYCLAAVCRHIQRNRVVPLE